MKRVLLSAFACDPEKGSEQGNGWNWAIGLARKGFIVHCFTRDICRLNIESKYIPETLVFHYVKLPFGLESLYGFSKPTMYIYYICWQWRTFTKAKKLHRKLGFDIAHHVTWGSFQLGSFMYKIGVPFVFGPAGGGQKAPVSFRKYFGQYWRLEEKRERISQLLLKYNPASRAMLKKAAAVFVSNSDTFRMVASRTRNVYTSLDAAVPTSFFPDEFRPKSTTLGKLSLLWIGRLLPRKGALLILDVMKQLKDYSGITLTVVGDGEQRPEFLSVLNEYSLETSVCYLGAVPYEQVRKFYLSHDVFFFTSLRDSCPAQLIEAMAFGMPIVTLNLHGQGAIVNEQTGFRCNCDTPEEAIMELKDAILQLYNNPSKVASMSEAAYNFAVKQTWDHKIKTITEQCYPK